MANRTSLDTCVKTGKLYLLADIEKFKVNDFAKHISDFLKKNFVAKNILFCKSH